MTQASADLNHAFTAFSLISFIIVLIPLPWHLESWNIGTCLFMIYTAVANLIGFVNSIVWDRNALDSAPIWCDIATRVLIFTCFGIPSATLCITRRLYYIATVKTTGISKEEKRRQVIIDFLIGVGIPVVGLACYYTYQGNRYLVYEDVGCLQSIWSSPVALMLNMIWPVLLSVISACYGVCAIFALNKRRLEVEAIISSSTSLSRSRYYRLMMLAGTDIIFTLPFAILALYLDVSINGVPAYSWDTTHNDFMGVYPYPAAIWTQASIAALVMLQMQRWLYVLSAFVFFAYFGFSEEARSRYWSILSSASRAIGFSTIGSYHGSSTGLSSSPSGSLPAFRAGKKAPSDKTADMSRTSFSTEISFSMMAEKDIETGSVQSIASPTTPVERERHPAPPGV